MREKKKDCPVEPGNDDIFNSSCPDLIRASFVLAGKEDGLVEPGNDETWEGGCGKEEVVKV
jgi:hypothetical protein